MKTMKKVMYFVLALVLTVGISSCEGPEGPAGADGTDGQDGTDGNANAQTYVFNNPAWGSASGMSINMPGILTDDVIQNDAILIYENHTTSFGDFTHIIPGSVWNGGYRDYAVFLYNSTYSNPETIGIASLEMDGSFTPNANLWTVNWVKVIIIASTNTTTVSGNGRMANTSSKEAVQQELAAANVDINDYYAVCAYYGIDPE